MLQFLIPLYYQLSQAYKPVSLIAPTPTVVPVVLGVSVTNPQPLPPIGGEGQVKTVALFGDSMIQTIKNNILERSLQKYFPTTKFNILNFGYSSTNFEVAVRNLPEIISQSPDIIIVESFAYNNFGNSQAGLEKHSQLLTDTIKTIKEKLPDTKIILAATIAPNSVVFSNGISSLHLTALEKIERTKTIRYYLENSVKYANKYGYPIIDVYNSSLVNNDGFLPLISSSDHLHPSDFGQELFGDILAKTIFDLKL